MLGERVTFQLPRGTGGHRCLLDALDMRIQPRELAVTSDPCRM
jgi:hypothetical protein